MRDRVLALGEAAGELLQRLVREMLARKPGGHLVEAALEELELPLVLALRGERATPESFSRELAARLEQVLDDAIQQAAVFRPGHAFCHKCGGAACEHSEPPSCRHVFVGYGPTGVPRWEDFAQVCLERRHPEVDRLYEDPPAFLTLVQEASVLSERMLGAFNDARTCELLGQVAAGFYRVPSRRSEGRNVMALTFQVLASRRRDGGLRIGLNLLGCAPEGNPLERLWEHYAEVPWRTPVRWAQQALTSLSRGARRQDGDVIEGRVEGILRGLARRLEREHRARSRRTHHAEERHLSGNRPTRKALEDVRSVRAGEVLVDEKNGTLVVQGARGRTHFFSPDGRLVTSVRYSREALERKRKVGVWRQAEPSEAERLLRVIMAAGARQADAS